MNWDKLMLQSLFYVDNLKKNTHTSQNRFKLVYKETHVSFLYPKMKHD